jgi:hypothetical protein
MSIQHEVPTPIAIFNTIGIQCLIVAGLILLSLPIVQHLIWVGLCVLIIVAIELDIFLFFKFPPPPPPPTPADNILSLIRRHKNNINH